MDVDATFIDYPTRYRIHIYEDSPHDPFEIMKEYLGVMRRHFGELTKKRCEFEAFVTANMSEHELDAVDYQYVSDLKLYHTIRVSNRGEVRLIKSSRNDLDDMVIQRKGKRILTTDEMCELLKEMVTSDLGCEFNWDDVGGQMSSWEGGK